MDVVNSDENKTLEDEEIDEVTELTDEGEETLENQFLDFNSFDNSFQMCRCRGRSHQHHQRVLMFLLIDCPITLSIYCIICRY